MRSKLGQCSPCCAANGRIDVTKGAWSCQRCFVNTALSSNWHRSTTVRITLQTSNTEMQTSCSSEQLNARSWSQSLRTVSMWRQCHFVKVNKTLWDWWSADELAWEWLSADELTWRWLSANELTWRWLSANELVWNSVGARETDWVQITWHDYDWVQNLRKPKKSLEKTKKRSRKPKKQQKIRESGPGDVNSKSCWE